MQTESKKLVKEYMKKIKEKLPEWLKEKEDEFDDVVDEIEDHLWSKAADLAKGEEPTAYHVREAIKSMGSPGTIAREYKKRGEPYIYITKELFPIYKRVLSGVILLVIVIATIVMVLNLVFGNIQDALNPSGWIIGIMGVIILVTGIFVGLSWEGFLPEDFKSKKQTIKEQEEIAKAKKMGMPISPKTGKPLKPFVSVSEKIVGGIIGMIFAIILIVQPIPVLFSVMDPTFLFFLQIIGLLSLVDGVFTLARGILGNDHYLAHQILEIATIFLKIGAVPILIMLVLNPNIFPILYYDGTTLINIGLASEYVYWFNLGMGLLVAIILLSIISNIYKIMKLERYKI